MLTKTNKAAKKRLKVTKNGKILARKPGQNHFRARKTRAKKLQAKAWQNLHLTSREKNELLPNF